MDEVAYHLVPNVTVDLQSIQPLLQCSEQEIAQGEGKEHVGVKDDDGRGGGAF